MGKEFPEEMRRFLERAVAKTVQVEPDTDDGQGAGVIVSRSGLIITAAHVVKGAKTAVVRRCRLKRSGWEIFCRGKYVCDVLIQDENLDIAVLRMREPPADLNVALYGDSDAVAPNTPLWRVGRDERPLSYGWVVSIEHESGVPSIKVSMPALPGASGGPVFNAGGRLVAVSLKYHSEKREPQACYALPINVVLTRVMPLLKLLPP